MPDKLKTKPYLYLTLGTQSNSFLAPFLSKESGIINIAGGYTLNPDGVDGAHVRGLIRKYSPNLMVVFLTSKSSRNSEELKPLPQVDDALQWYGLRSDMRDCAVITVHDVPPELEIRYQTSAPQEPQDRQNTYVAACGVVPDAADRSALIARQTAVNLVLDRLEDACPELFQPRRLVTLHYGEAWRRLYGATDIVAWVSYGRVKFSDQIRPHGLIDVGSESDWASAPLRLDCGKHNGVYFAHIVSANQ